MSPVRLVVAMLVLSAISLAQQATDRSAGDGLLQGALTAPGSPSFHLKAAITGRDDGDSGDVEIFWVNPSKWRRTINSPAFSQTLVVNGTQVSEQNSDDYFPVTLQVLLAAMTDPRPLIESLGPGDRLLTKANGGTKPPPICEHFNPRSSVGMEMICHQGPYKDLESIVSPTQGVSFANYEDFKGKKVARILIRRTQMVRVTELSELKKPDDTTFAVESPTPIEKQLHIVTLQEAELRGQAMQPLEIIWPQALDGATTGPSSYYVSIDRTGSIRETVIVKSANERANESALRQIEKWKFKPVVKDGIPVQAGGILTFTTDTRAWGPPNPLTDAEARKLASNVSDPIFPPGTASGASCTVRIAIDEEGNLIEAIAGEGTPGLFGPCYQAVKMWQFHPILQDGQPRPYRAELVFHAP
ncbi:MAG: energy transducer TonB [Terriglobales bacterium]